MKIGSYVKQLFSTLDRLAFTALVVATLSVSTVQAVPLAQFSDDELQVEARSDSPLIVDKKTGFEPRTSTKKFESLVEFSGEPFGKHLDRGPFASAIASAAHAGGVGASGFFFGKNVNLTAQRLSRDSITNVGTEAFNSFLVYDIEPIDVGVLPGDGFHGEVAGIIVSANVEHFHNGISSGSESVLNYALTVSKPRNNGGDAAFDVFRSDDLIADAGAGTEISNGGLFGVHYDGFDNERLLGTLEPGDTVTVQYDWSAFVTTGGTPELAAEAFVGDPFDLTGTGGGFSFVVGDGVPPPPPVGGVPEPSTLAILGLGLALYGIASRRLQN